MRFNLYRPIVEERKKKLFPINADKATISAVPEKAFITTLCGKPINAVLPN